MMICSASFLDFAKLASAYVELIRNIPLLLQLFLWYTLINSLPGARQALNPLPAVFLSNRGLTFPVLVGQPVHWVMLALFVVGMVATIAVRRWAQRRQAETGRPVALLLPALLMAASVDIRTHVGESP